MSTRYSSVGKSVELDSLFKAAVHVCSSDSISRSVSIFNL